MKRAMILAVVLLAFAGTAGVFASGGKEQAAPPAAPGPGPGPRGAFGPRGWQQGPTFSEEKVSVTGTLYFENLMHPELKSGGKNYELMVPPFYLDEVDLKDGATVTVEGYTVSGMPLDDVEDKDDVYLRVTKAVVDGKEYDLEGYGPRAGGPWMNAPRGGMMGPRGRGDWGSMPYMRHGRRW